MLLIVLKFQVTSLRLQKNNFLVINYFNIKNGCFHIDRSRANKNNNKKQNKKDQW